MFESQPVRLEVRIERNSWRSISNQTFKGLPEMSILNLTKGKYSTVARKFVMAFTVDTGQGDRGYGPYGNIDLIVEDQIALTLDGTYERLWKQRDSRRIHGNMMFDGSFKMENRGYDVLRLAATGGMSMKAYESAADMLFFSMVLYDEGLREWFQGWFPDWSRSLIYSGHIKKETERRRCPAERKKYLYYRGENLTQYTEDLEDDETG